MLTGKRILVIITGSIAAYKSLELIRLLVKAGASVEGLLTEGGAQFITPLAVEAVTGKRCHTEMWDDNAAEMNHIELSRRADLILVAPATADIIAKMSLGLGTDLASTVLLARNKPVMLAPGMNTAMWENPAFKRNLALAEADGAIVIPPHCDTLACGEVGMGKMAEPANIFEVVRDFFRRDLTLEGKSAIVTTGGTIERIDSVRYISNFSSGKQGNAIAIALAERGAKVTLVAGNVSCHFPRHRNILIQQVESAENMKAAVHAALPADIFVSCAAVCDFRVANKASQKIKKEDGMALQFEENPDIAQSIGTLPAGQRPQLVVGFAAETDKLIEYAQGKLLKKGCDLIVANNVANGAVFGREENEVHFVTPDKVEALAPMPKADVANAIANWIQNELSEVGL